MARFVLQIVEGPEAGRAFELGDAPLEIGRGEEVGIRLEHDDLASRRHVRLTAEAGDVAVEDLGSRNGTFVNGDELHGPGRLAPGGRLLVGVTLFELRAPAAPPTAVQPVPRGLTGARPAALVAPPRTPDYVPGDAAEASRETPLSGLLDVHTKNQARRAPLAIFVLVAFVVILALALR